ncbi:MAG: AAA family ATPase, partial [Rivularia sp. ALOHA_DT_140]|nr:AAA family ATPase [Rivularia sp. ALOHA_DT_140]
MAFGVISGAAFNIAFSVAFHIPSDILFGVLFGVLFGLLFGVLFGTVSAVLLGVAFILGVLRVYLWLPELLSVTLLFLFTHKGRFASRLRYLT